MNPPDERTAKAETTERQSAGAAAGSDDQVEEQLRDVVKEFQRLQSKPAEDLHGSDDNLNEQLRQSPEDLRRPSAQRESAEDIQKVFLRMTSERKALYDRLSAIDSHAKRLETQTKRRPSRAFGRYLVGICIGVAATLAWQSYGEATKRIIATSAPELGWSPEGKQMIAGWVEQLGWTKPQADAEGTVVRSPVPETPQAAPVVQTAPAVVAPSIAPSIDPEQVQQMTQSLATLGQAVERIAAGQDQMAREIARLDSAVAELNVKIPEPRPQPPAAAAHKPARVPPQSSRPPIASSRAPIPRQQ
jgi:hypothetical protein